MGALPRKCNLPVGTSPTILPNGRWWRLILCPLCLLDDGMISVIRLRLVTWMDFLVFNNQMLLNIWRFVNINFGIIWWFSGVMSGKLLTPIAVAGWPSCYVDDDLSSIKSNTFSHHPDLWQVELELSDLKRVGWIAWCLQSICQ